MDWNNNWSDLEKKRAAILSINSALVFHTFEGSLDITWAPENTAPVPTEEEIQAEIARLQAEYDSQEYARKRKAEYDQLNQFEMMFDDKRDGTTTWLDTINEIKAKHPKE